MDVTPVVGILAIVGLVTLVVLAAALGIVVVNCLSLGEGDQFFGDEGDIDDSCSAL